MEAPLYIRKNLFPRGPIGFLQMIINAARATAAAHKNPVVRTNPLKSLFNSSLRAQIRPQFSFPFFTLIHLDALRRPKNPNPRITKGALSFLRILCTYGYQQEILGKKTSYK